MVNYTLKRPSSWTHHYCVFCHKTSFNIKQHEDYFQLLRTDVSRTHGLKFLVKQVKLCKKTKKWLFLIWTRQCAAAAAADDDDDDDEVMTVMRWWWGVDDGAGDAV